MDVLNDVAAEDWRLAMTQWVQRRADRSTAKAQEGGVAA